MDDIKISLSVPATIYNFGETEGLTQNKYVTHAKLRIFYVGKTGDNRVFTKQFSDQLLQTLPGTPVVAYYDEDSDDFIGHNHIQYVFGYVPEAATIGYETNPDGTTFAVTDVLLFTGRNDNIGEIAGKIIGKSHSLELDPGTVEYTIVRASGSIESITFTKGDFIGLSVLGDNERPAFSGSAFFSADADVNSFVQSFQEFKKEVEFYKSGGKLMLDENSLPTLEETAVEQVEENSSFEENTEEMVKKDDEEKEEEVMEEPMEEEEKEEEKYSESTEEVVSEIISEETSLQELENPGDPSETQSEEFIANPYEDKEKRVYAALAEMYPNVQFEIEQMDDAWVVYKEVVYDQNGFQVHYFRIAYTDTGMLAELNGGPTEVYKRFLTQEEANQLFGQPMVEETTEMSEEISETVADVESLKGMEDDTDTKQQEKQEVFGEQVVTDTTALDNAERQELNEYRKKAKFEIIDSYDDLDLEVLDKYREAHDQFTVDQLDKELAYELVKSQRQVKKAGVKVFSMADENRKPTTVEELVNAYKDRK